jgi:hypothetical protein
MKQLTTTKSKLLGVLLFSVASLSLSAQLTISDTICAGATDVIYGVSNPTPTSTYSWSLSNTTAGTIDNSISLNDSVIEIDWGATSGTYTLSVVETSVKGCVGDPVSLSIVLQDAPTIVVTGDSVCLGDVGTMTWALTGTSPWTVDYTDGTNTYTIVAINNTHTINLPAYTSTANISIISLSDASTAACVPANLPSTVLYVYPKPSTGSIFHY